MSISIQTSPTLTHTFRRYTEDDAVVKPDFEKSTARTGPVWNLHFKGDDVLEVRSNQATASGYDILVGPEKYPDSIIVRQPMMPGMRGSSSTTPPFQRVNFEQGLPAENLRRFALQVASSLTQVPFLDRLLDLPVEPTS